MADLTPTPDQALKFLSTITAGIQANRETHNQIVLSIKVLERAIMPNQEATVPGEKA